MCLCVSICIFVCVVGLAELLTNAKGETRLLNVILSSLPCEYRDFGQNEALNEPQCCNVWMENKIDFSSYHSRYPIFVSG